VIRVDSFSRNEERKGKEQRGKETILEENSKRGEPWGNKVGCGEARPSQLVLSLFPRPWIRLHPEQIAGG